MGAGVSLLPNPARGRVCGLPAQRGRGGAAVILFRAATALLLCALAACGGPGEEPAARLTRLPAGAVVLAFGNSLTHGTGAGGLAPAPGLSYPEVLARNTGLRVVRSGVPGETTDRGLARLPGVLARERPALALLEHGGNDLLRGLPEAATAANLAAMVRACREAGAQVLLLGVPRPGLRLAVHPLYARVAEKTGAALEPDLLSGLLSDASLKSDPLHLNAAGYARLAQGIETALRRLGALP